MAKLERNRVGSKGVCVCEKHEGSRSEASSVKLPQKTKQKHNNNPLQLIAQSPPT